MTNDEMKPNRYGRWAQARKKIAFIKGHLEQNHTVEIATALRVYRLKKKHIEMVKATRTGAFVQSGSKWFCIDYTSIRAFS
jgi:hypothetical protein